jgi:4-aminobutyrate aminotransferase
MAPGAFRVEFPNYYRNPWGFSRQEDVDAECLRQIELVLKREPEMAAVVGEPISATPVIPSPKYWQGVKKLCEHYGALLIFDEIIEGFGRTGKMFACEHFVTPDILVIGKSFGGGLMPFAGIVAAEKYNVCQHRSVGHYTHEKSALCAAAALAEINYIEEHKLYEHAAELGKYTLSRLIDLQENHPLIGHVAGLGLHLGLDLVSDRKTRKRAFEEAEVIMFKCLEKGLSAKTIEGNILTLRPALVITQAEMDQAIDIIDEAIGEVEQGKKY